MGIHVCSILLLYGSDSFLLYIIIPTCTYVSALRAYLRDLFREWVFAFGNRGRGESLSQTKEQPRLRRRGRRRLFCGERRSGELSLRVRGWWMLSKFGQSTNKIDFCKLSQLTESV